MGLGSNLFIVIISVVLLSKQYLILYGPNQFCLNLHVCSLRAFGNQNTWSPREKDLGSVVIMCS